MGRRPRRRNHRNSILGYGMLYHSYLKNGMVYVPTVAKTEARFYMDRERVSLMAAPNTDALRRAVQDAVGRGNPIIPAPPRAAFPRLVLLKYSGTKT